MTKFKSSGFRESVSNAVHGLKLAFFSQRNFVIEVIISSKSPVGTSVLPQVPLNNVSPENTKFCSFFQWKNALVF